MTNRYYAIEFVSEATDVPASTIRRWIAEGRITSLLHNRVRYVTRAEVTQLRDTLKTRQEATRLQKPTV